jgi:peptidoglycan DL-endopeptidase CwlO
MVAKRSRALLVAAALCGATSLLAGCASAPTAAGTIPVPQPFPVPGGAATAGAPDGTSVPPRAPSRGVDRHSLVGLALGYRGTPYRFGGTDPATGFDCSGFTQYIFGRYGIELPRDVIDQFKVGTPVKMRNVQPGDLLFFTTDAPGASHVAIAIGDGQFVHAPSSKGVVRVERLNSSYWSRRFVGARRVEAN